VYELQARLAEVAASAAKPGPNLKSGGPRCFPPSRGPPLSSSCDAAGNAPNARSAFPSLVAGPDNEPPRSGSLNVSIPSASSLPANCGGQTN